MKKTRVPYGEMYWCYVMAWGSLTLIKSNDTYELSDNENYRLGNYFHTREEAESFERKLRAVLKGADVIDVTTANVGSADELDAKKHQIELILSHRQTIVIAEHKGSLDWRWNTKSIETRNDMLKTVISKNEINFTKEEDLPRYVNYLLAEAKHKVK